MQRIAGIINAFAQSWSVFFAAIVRGSVTVLSRIESKARSGTPLSWGDYGGMRSWRMPTVLKRDCKGSANSAPP